MRRFDCQGRAQRVFLRKMAKPAWTDQTSARKTICRLIADRKAKRFAAINTGKILYFHQRQVVDICKKQDYAKPEANLLFRHPALPVAVCCEKTSYPSGVFLFSPVNLSRFASCNAHNARVGQGGALGGIHAPTRILKMQFSKGEGLETDQVSQM